MGSSIIPILVAKAERDIVESLRLAGATSAAAARPVPTPRHFAMRQLGRLQREGVIHEVAGGRYWLDEEAWVAFRGRRRRIVIALVAVALLVLLGLAWAVARRVGASGDQPSSAARSTAASASTSASSARFDSPATAAASIARSRS